MYYRHDDDDSKGEWFFGIWVVVIGIAWIGSEQGWW